MVLPSLVDLEQVNIAALSVVPLDTPQSELRSTLLQVSAIRFTHDTIDGRAIFMHDDSGHKKHVDAALHFIRRWMSLAWTCEARRLAPIGSCAMRW